MSLPVSFEATLADGPPFRTTEERPSGAAPSARARSRSEASAGTVSWPRPAASPVPALLSLFALGCLAGVLAGHAASLGPARVATFWPAAGLYLAALLIAGERWRWPAVLASPRRPT